jgi:hypothetical protein
MSPTDQTDPIRGWKVTRKRGETICHDAAGTRITRLTPEQQTAVEDFLEQRRLHAFMSQANRTYRNL